ncbi:MAG TPA: ISNCY family transposase [Thermoanaerobaculia bacterium]|jgi:IS5 family transposase
MHIRRREQRTIFDAALVNLFADPEALRMDAELARIDELLEDAELVAIVHRALGKRRPNSTTTGRAATPSEVVLRMLVRKHLRNWSYGTLEREVRANLVYRQFTRVGTERVPDAKSLIKIANVLGPETIRAIHERVVEIARVERVAKGRKLRVDTTVVETNVRYPTDSRLLADAMRVMTRLGTRIETVIGTGKDHLRNRLRSAGRRVLEIALSARNNSKANEQRRRRLYQRLLGTARSVIRDVQRIAKRARRSVARGADDVVESLGVKLCNTIRLAERIVDQTRARILHGDVHHENKVLSMFESDTEAIRKGKAAKPTEFGKMVKIQEAERQIVTDYQVEPRRIADSDLLTESIEIHRKMFGRVPRMVAADSGFYSQNNERTATEMGVAYVAIPNRRSRSDERRKRQKTRRFRRAQAWRTGCEGRISVLKRRHGLARCRYRGIDGMNIWVGLGVIANNLVAVARVQVKR